MALLFLTCRLQALWFGYDGPDIVPTEPMVMSLQEVRRPTIARSKENTSRGRKIPELHGVVCVVTSVSIIGY